MNRPTVVPINRSESQCNSLDPKGSYPIDPGVFTSAALNLCIRIMIHTIYTCIFITGSFENHFVMLSMLNFGPHDSQKLGQYYHKSTYHNGVAVKYLIMSISEDCKLCLSIKCLINVFDVINIMFLSINCFIYMRAWVAQ